MTRYYVLANIKKEVKAEDYFVSFSKKCTNDILGFVLTWAEKTNANLHDLRLYDFEKKSQWEEFVNHIRNIRES